MRPVTSKAILAALVVATAFNLTNAALGWLSLQQLGPDTGNIAQLCLGISAAIAGLWAAATLALRQPSPLTGDGPNRRHGNDG